MRIERARLYATSAGINQLHLNGQVVGTSLLAPGWSAYADRLRYETHDVTDLLSTGANVLGAVVADGWWRGYLTWEMLRDVYGDRHGLLAQLEVTYSDGSTETFGTGANWVTSDGPIRSADLYNGEAFDARLDHGRLGQSRIRRLGLARHGGVQPQGRQARVAHGAAGAAHHGAGRRARHRHPIGQDRPRLRPEPGGPGAIRRRRPGRSDDHTPPRRGDGARGTRGSASPPRQGDRRVRPAGHRDRDMGADVHLPWIPLRRGGRLAR